MEYVYGILGWGSPLGIGLFLFCCGSGTGLFLWGLARLKQAQGEQ